MVGVVKARVVGRVEAGVVGGLKARVVGEDDAWVVGGVKAKVVGVVKVRWWAGLRRGWNIILGGLSPPKQALFRVKHFLLLNIISVFNISINIILEKVNFKPIT